MMKRGHPKTLVLCPLPDRKIGHRAPGFGLSISIAKAYNLGIKGFPTRKVPRSGVVHQPKKINGWWIQPSYTGLVEVDIACDNKLLVHKGTQFVDGFWTLDAPANEPLCLANIRMAHWRRWAQGTDICGRCCATVCLGRHKHEMIGRDIHGGCLPCGD
eukprot:2730904-Amphidinium_carterae.2